MQTLLSVVIPVYQGEKTIARAVKSVLAIPLGEELEVVVVNDGSRDDTGAILERMSLLDSRLRVLTIENCGRSAARNLGVRNACGRWLMFLDADDYLLPEGFPELVECCRTRESGFVVFGRRQSNKPEYAEWALTCGKQHIAASRYVDSLLWEAKPRNIADEWRYNHGATWSRLYDREALLALDYRTDGLLAPFPERVRFSEDRLLNIALLKTMGDVEVEFIPTELYYWDLGESQTCQVIHEDDADSLMRFVEVVSGMVNCGILSPEESDAVIGREAFWQFQRLTRHASELGWSLPELFRAVFARKEITGAVKRTPYSTLTYRALWRPACKLLGNGAVYTAFLLYSAARAVKNALKGRAG